MLDRVMVSDWVKYGLHFLVLQIFLGKSLLDPKWFASALFIIGGLAVYHMFVRKYINISPLPDDIEPIVKDWLYFGTMLTVARVLSEKPLNRKWWIATLLTLMGFTAYHLIVKQFVNPNKMIQEPRVQVFIEDILKYGTMLIVTHVLSGGKIVDAQFYRATTATLVGFAIYDLFLKHWVETGAVS